MKLRRPNLEAIYREVDHYIPKKENLQPPRIGISANRKDGLSCIAETYVQAVLKAGGAPVLIPVITDIEALTAIVNGLDGLVMSGGDDINPLYMQEEPIPALQDVDTYRDEYDLILLRLATNRQLPGHGNMPRPPDTERRIWRQRIPGYPYPTQSKATETQPDAFPRTGFPFHHTERRPL